MRLLQEKFQMLAVISRNEVTIERTRDDYCDGVVLGGGNYSTPGA